MDTLSASERMAEEMVEEWYSESKELCVFLSTQGADLKARMKFEDINEACDYSYITIYGDHGEEITIDRKDIKDISCTSNSIDINMLNGSDLEFVEADAEEEDFVYVKSEIGGDEFENLVA